MYPDPASSASASTNGTAQPFSFDVAVRHLEAWVHGFIRLLPNIGVAIIVLAIFWGLAALIHRWIRAGSARSNRANLGEVLGGFIKWCVLVLGFLIAATIVIPSINPGDLVAGLGVSSVAIGFAFKDILQNWLAGMLLLIRQPFQVNDQISVGGHEGTVERIETRATVIKTYDGQRVLIPNSDIYTNAMQIKTAYDVLRSQYDVGIGYGDDIDQACEVIRTAVAGVEGVMSDPAVEALPWDLAASWVTIRARWWTSSRRADVVHTQSKVIRAMKQALDAAGIDMPYETRVQLLHDQSEARDGIRGSQREGWPSPKDSATVPRWKAEHEARASHIENPPGEANARSTGD